ncbi:MAG: hypothetical protein JXA54_03915, partial [Candidatus Heimdallarchaeota archaeon]|nr:hypothetical protein [Candidatus Heimdallarchaeota archaeon]
NDTTIEIEIREGIKWQSDPDEIYTNEYLDVNDVYFTLYSWKYVSNDYNRWDWIKDMEIVDQYTMIIYVDGDPSTPENDAYAPSLPALATRILPEHYLNQTQEGDGVTPDILHPSWNTYATAAFGTGPFKITSFTEGVETILTLREDYWGLNETITNDPNLNWEERWGFGAQFATNGLTQQRIRIIPDRQTAILEFEAGKIDIESVTDLTNKRYEMQTNPNFKVQSDLSFAFAFVGFNMRENRQHIGSQVAAPNDPEITIGLAVRKAICYAIDRVEMNNVIHAGEYQIVHWPIYPKMGIWCNPDIIQYNYNLNKAKEYMQIAGFDLGYTPSVQLGIPVQNLFNILTIITMMTIITVKKKV